MGSGDKGSSDPKAQAESTGPSPTVRMPLVHKSKCLGGVCVCGGEGLEVRHCLGPPCLLEKSVSPVGLVVSLKETVMSCMKAGG